LVAAAIVFLLRSSGERTSAPALMATAPTAAPHPSPHECMPFDGLPSAPNRRAFIVGITHYTVLRPTPNMVEDATKLADGLSRLGFSGTLCRDVRYASLRTAAREFLASLTPATQVVAWIGGHGRQAGAVPYLLALDFVLGPDGAQELFDVADFADALASSARADTGRLLVLNACRDGQPRGFYPRTPPRPGLFQLYAVAPGGRVATGDFGARETPLGSVFFQTLQRDAALDLGELLQRVSVQGAALRNHYDDIWTSAPELLPDPRQAAPVFLFAGVPSSPVEDAGSTSGSSQESTADGGAAGADSSKTDVGGANTAASDPPAG
jgi:hypothetical protein